MFLLNVIDFCFFSSMEKKVIDFSSNQEALGAHETLKE
jgi:hypothetical protein